MSRAQKPSHYARVSREELEVLRELLAEQEAGARARLDTALRLPRALDAERRRAEFARARKAADIVRAALARLHLGRTHA